MAKSTVSGSQKEVVRGDGQFGGVGYLAAPSGTPAPGAALIATGNGSETAWSTSWYNVQAYGATGNDSTSDTTAIAAALTAAGYAGGGTVYLPPGTYLTGALSIPQNVTIRGAGIDATTLKLSSSAAKFDNLLTNAQLIGTTYDANCCQVRDMTLDGNAGAMSAGWWNSGIVFSNRTPSGGYEYLDGRHQASNLLIQNFTGDGLVQAGRGESQFSDIQVWLVNGFGFNINEDSEYSNCDAGGCGLDGFLIQGGSNRLVGCKSWFSGAKLTSTRGSGASATTVAAPSGTGAPDWDGGNQASPITFSLANGYGSGFLWLSISGTSTSGNHSTNTLAGCGAQDNARNGFCLNGSRQVLAGVEADSNSNCGVTSGTTPLASYAGFDIDCDRSVIIGISWDRGANTNHQAAAVNFISGDPGNVIDMVFYGSLNDGSNMPPLLASSTGNTQSSLRFNGMGPGSIQFPNFAASYTPDPFLGEVVSMTLTGAITVNNPALTGTNTTGTFLIPGQKLTLILTQDGSGGHAVTLGGAFRLNGKSFSTSASATTAIPFIWDGTSWQA